ncbi:hypothetical protein [Risungbinella massiliensis]|uniref:hypothetical protein n=1 Tax=Risungbinella massiliensis TaxID=1329796 RepID=UPI0005CC8CB6|nr:hypothetical protein [Risungbinella massiliensis]
MRKPPVIYFDWMQLLDELETADNKLELMTLLHQGIAPDTENVRGRVAVRVVEIIHKWLDQATKYFQEQTQQGFAESEWIKAINLLRKRLTTTWQLGQMPFLPGNIVDQIDQEIEKYVQNLQQNMVESAAKHEITGRLASFLRNNPISLIKEPFMIPKQEVPN